MQVPLNCFDPQAQCPPRLCPQDSLNYFGERIAGSSNVHDRTEERAWEYDNGGLQVKSDGRRCLTALIAIAVKYRLRCFVFFPSCDP